MSKIGLGGTLFTIYSGFIFIALGASFLTWQLKQGNIESLTSLWSIAAIMILLYGLTLVVGAFWQWNDIKKGKEYFGPPDDLK